MISKISDVDEDFEKLAINTSIEDILASDVIHGIFLYLSKRFFKLLRRLHYYVNSLQYLADLRLEVHKV